MLDLNDADLPSDAAAVVAMKKPIPVPVRFAAAPGVVNTREGPVAYEAGAAICRGVQGEEWPVQRARFDVTYESLPGTEPGRDGLYVKKPAKVHAKQITEDRFFVKVGVKRQAIYGEAGDWLIQYSPEKRSVISDEAFRASYDLIASRPAPH
jgi:PGDYG protein